MSIKDFDKTNVVNELDLGNCFPGNYFRVEIHIETEYKWGPGWSSLAAKERFETEVYRALKKANYEIVESNIFNAAPSLAKKRSQLNLYLHPMNFSGYATQEDIDKIVDILKNCKEVKDIISVNKIPSYDISDKAYARILAMNIDFIKNFILENSKKMHITDIPSAFARQYELVITGKSSTLGSDNFSWKYVENIIDIMIANGELECPDWY